jgi:hypothetical protein
LRRRCACDARLRIAAGSRLSAGALKHAPPEESIGNPYKRYRFSQSFFP